MTTHAGRLCKSVIFLEGCTCWFCFTSSKYCSLVTCNRSYNEGESFITTLYGQTVFWVVLGVVGFPTVLKSPYLTRCLIHTTGAVRVWSGIVHFNKSQPRGAGAQIQVQLVSCMAAASIYQPLVSPVVMVLLS